MFQPRPEYDVVSDKIQIEDFHRYSDDFVACPPYQRKTVWNVRKRQALLDSHFRSNYIPKSVIREVRLGQNKDAREVVDGQQRMSIDNCGNRVTMICRQQTNSMLWQLNKLICQCYCALDSCLRQKYHFLVEIMAKSHSQVNR